MGQPNHHLESALATGNLHYNPMNVICYDAVNFTLIITACMDRILFITATVNIEVSIEILQSVLQGSQSSADAEIGAIDSEALEY